MFTGIDFIFNSIIRYLQFYIRYTEIPKNIFLRKITFSFDTKRVDIKLRQSNY